jgi:hypothetical protein
MTISDASGSIQMMVSYVSDDFFTVLGTRRARTFLWRSWGAGE